MHFATWGVGANHLLALHGFGRTHRDFLRFTRPLNAYFRIHAADIFFHGESIVERENPDENPIEIQEWIDFVNAFLDELGVDKVWLMGYSLGGRLCQVIAEHLPHRVGGLYLLAPDGLIVNRWYALFSHYSAGRSLFRFFKRRPAWFFRSLWALRKANIVSERTADFVREEVGSAEGQERVYMVWCFLRKLEPNHKALAEGLSANQVSLDLYFGMYDRIIRPAQADKLCKYYLAARLHMLRSGHFLLTAANGIRIVRDDIIQLPANDAVS